MEKTKLMNQLENLLTALQMYQQEEERAMNRLTELLRAYGLDVSVDDIEREGVEGIRKIIEEEK